MIRHPLAEKLYALHQRRNATAKELHATLEMAQLAVEQHWDELAGLAEQRSRNGGFPDPRWYLGKTQCAHPGCNYRRYPASQFCMYHVTGNDTFAARLRRAERPAAKPHRGRE